MNVYSLPQHLKDYQASIQQSIAFDPGRQRLLMEQSTNGRYHLKIESKPKWWWRILECVYKPQKCRINYIEGKLATYFKGWEFCSQSNPSLLLDTIQAIAHLSAILKNPASIDSLQQLQQNYLHDYQKLINQQTHQAIQTACEQRRQNIHRDHLLQRKQHQKWLGFQNHLLEDELKQQWSLQEAPVAQAIGQLKERLNLLGEKLKEQFSLSEHTKWERLQMPQFHDCVLILAEDFSSPFKNKNETSFFSNPLKRLKTAFNRLKQWMIINADDDQSNLTPKFLTIDSKLLADHMPYFEALYTHISKGNLNKMEMDSSIKAQFPQSHFPNLAYQIDLTEFHFQSFSLLLNILILGQPLKQLDLDSLSDEEKDSLVQERLNIYLLAQFLGCEKICQQCVEQFHQLLDLDLAVNLLKAKLIWPPQDPILGFSLQIVRENLDALIESNRINQLPIQTLLEILQEEEIAIEFGSAIYREVQTSFQEQGKSLTEFFTQIEGRSFLQALHVEYFSDQDWFQVVNHITDDSFLTQLKTWRNTPLQSKLLVKSLTKEGERKIAWILPRAQQLIEGRSGICSPPCKIGTAELLFKIVSENSEKKFIGFYVKQSPSPSAYYAWTCPQLKYETANPILIKQNYRYGMEITKKSLSKQIIGNDLLKIEFMIQFT